MARIRTARYQPLQEHPLAIPHLSAGGLDFLIEDFQKSFIRRMGMCTATVDAGLANAAVNPAPVGGAAASANYLNVGMSARWALTALFGGLGARNLVKFMNSNIRSFLNAVEHLEAFFRNLELGFFGGPNHQILEAQIIHKDVFF